MPKRTRREFTNEFNEEVRIEAEQSWMISEASHNHGVQANLSGRWKRDLSNVESGFLFGDLPAVLKLRKQAIKIWNVKN